MLYLSAHIYLGDEIMAVISGRLRSTLKGVVISVRAAETDIPPWYVEGKNSRECMYVI